MYIVQWSQPYSTLAPTQDSNPGGLIQNHKRWPRTALYYCSTTDFDLHRSSGFQITCGSFAILSKAYVCLSTHHEWRYKEVNETFPRVKKQSHTPYGAGSIEGSSSRRKSWDDLLTWRPGRWEDLRVDQKIIRTTRKMAVGISWRWEITSDRTWFSQVELRMSRSVRRA